MIKDKDLKPCPFCGNKAEIKRSECAYPNFESYTYKVECTKIECNYLYDNKQEAIENWNIRND